MPNDLDYQVPGSEASPRGHTEAEIAGAKIGAQKALERMKAALAVGDQATANFEARLASAQIGAVKDSIYDPQTQSIRDKTWWERNSENVMIAVGMVGAAFGGMYLSGVNAASGGVTAGVSTGAAPAVPVATGATSAIPAAVPAATSGELAAVTGLPAAATGLPGAVAAPIAATGASAPALTSFPIAPLANAAPVAGSTGSGAAIANALAPATSTAASHSSLWPLATKAGITAAAGLFGGQDEPNTNDNDILKAIQGNDANASKLLGQGQEALSPVFRYLNAIVRGEPNAILQATQPERRSILSQYDAARKSIGEFTPRGGGQGAALATSRFKEAGDVAELFGKARREGVSTLGNLGAGLTSLGTQAKASSATQLQNLYQTILGRQAQEQATDAQTWESIGNAAMLALMYA